MVAGAILAGVSMAMLSFLDSLCSVVAIRLLQGVTEAAFMVASFALVRQGGALWCPSGPYS